MDATQGSEAWIKIRLGRCTASRVADALAKLKTGGWGESRHRYRRQLVTERLTGVLAKKYQSESMLYGIETEAKARNRYALLFETVTEAGFYPHPGIMMAGATPDGLIGNEGLLEIKCPDSETHVDTLSGVGISGRYLTQIQFQLACTQRQWCDFVSFDCRIQRLEMQLWRQRIYRDDKKIKELEDGVRGFLAEVDEVVANLAKRFPMTEAA